MVAFQPVKYESTVGQLEVYRLAVEIRVLGNEIRKGCPLVGGGDKTRAVGPMLIH